ATRVVLDRRVDEPLDFGKGHDLVELARDLCTAHSEDGAAQEDVLAPGQLGVESRADLEQGADAAADLGETGRRIGDAREDLQEGALARSVAADQADDVAVVDVE